MFIFISISNLQFSFFLSMCQIESINQMQTLNISIHSSQTDSYFYFFIYLFFWLFVHSNEPFTLRNRRKKKAISIDDEKTMFKTHQKHLDKKW